MSLSSFSRVLFLLATTITLINAFNQTVGTDELLVIDAAARVQISELVLQDYNKLVSDYEQLSRDCEQNVNSAIGICEGCGKKPKLKEILKQAVGTVISKAVDGIKRIGKKAGNLVKDLGKKVVGHSVKVLQSVGKAFKTTTKVVSSAIKGVRNAFRSVRRVVRKIVRVRLPRVRLPRVRRIVRLPRVRVPRIRVRFGRRWGKKKRSELTKRQIEDLTNMAMSFEQHELSERDVVPVTCDTCQLDENSLLNYICGEMMGKQSRILGQLESLEKIVGSLEEKMVITSVSYDDDSFVDVDDNGNSIFKSVYISTSFDDSQFSFKTNADYIEGDETALETMGPVVGQEAYQKYKELSGM